MPTNQDLQEINDYLLGENERLQAELRNATPDDRQEELRALQDENRLLREQLRESETQRLDLRETVNTYNARRQNELAQMESERRQMERLREIEVGRLEIEARKLAVERQQTQAESQQKNKEIAGLHQQAQQSETTIRTMTEQAKQQAERVLRLQSQFSKAQTEAREREYALTDLRQEHRSVQSQFRELQETPPRSLTVELFEMLTEKPGCLLLIIIALIVLAFGYYALSLIWQWVAPSSPSPMLGR